MLKKPTAYCSDTFNGHNIICGIARIQLHQTLRYSKRTLFKSLEKSFSRLKILTRKSPQWQDVNNSDVQSKEKKMHFFRSVLFYVFSIPFCFSNVDYKCDNGVPIAIQWWNQEPYIYHVNSHFETQPDSANKSQGLFPWFLKHVLSKCCRASTANYTKISGPAGLPGVLSIGDFDLILPVVSKLEAVSVRGFPYVGVFESPGVAFLTKGNVSGTQLLFAVLGAWPILVFILMSAALAGVIIWLLVSLRTLGACSFGPIPE